MDTIYKLRNKFDNFYTLCAARSTEIEKINKEIPLEFWDKVNLTEVIELKELERDQNIELIRLCCNEFNIEASDNVVLSLAAKNERSAGTPFYIVSVLIKFRDGKIWLEDIENLPGDVVKLWKDIYFPALSGDEKAVLYCLKLLKLIYTPAFKEIVRGMWKIIFEKSKADLFTAIESLKRKIWLKEAENTYSSFDVQLEAVEIEDGWFDDFEKFVESNELKQKYQSLLLFNLSYYYSEKIKESRTKVELSSNLEKAIKYIEEAIGIYKELGLKADVATSMNNASNFYSDLAGLEETKEARKEKLDNAVEYIEEAIGIYKELGLKANLAHSLAISVFVYRKIIEFDANYFMKAAVNCDEAIKIFLDFGMVYKAKPLIPYGIRFHETLYIIDNEERHKQNIEFYKSIGS
jgi:tetratricopeptide (TPR) repeat protein